MGLNGTCQKAVKLNCQKWNYSVCQRWSHTSPWPDGWWLKYDKERLKSSTCCCWAMDEGDSDDPLDALPNSPVSHNVAMPLLRTQSLSLSTARARACKKARMNERKVLSKTNKAGSCCFLIYKILAIGFCSEQTWSHKIIERLRVSFCFSVSARVFDGWMFEYYIKIKQSRLSIASR